MRTIYCCNCKKEMSCNMVKGDVVYPNRRDLFYKKFWQCPECKGFVGTHNQGTGKKPTGCIASKEIKAARIHIHSILDPLWRGKKIKRSEIYKKISDFLGYEYHTAELREIDEARKVYRFIAKIYCVR